MIVIRIHEGGIEAMTGDRRLGFDDEPALLLYLEYLLIDIIHIDDYLETGIFKRGTQRSVQCPACIRIADPEECIAVFLYYLDIPLKYFRIKRNSPMEIPCRYFNMGDGVIFHK